LRSVILNQIAMRKIVLILIGIALFASCKTSKKAVVQPKPVEVVEKVAEPVKEIPAPVVNEPVDETPIVIRTEEVKFIDDKAQTASSFDFYVIIGSFSVKANAEKNKVEMINKGFTPVVLTTDSGLFRVAVEQTNSEVGARAFVTHIRKQFPEHKDVWLLKKR
jgi:cell division protein FtsN